MWSVRSLTELRIFKKFQKVTGFQIWNFFKAPVPTRSNETFTANYFFKKLLFPPESRERNGNGGTFFFNGGLLPNSWVSRLKIFVSERTSDPSPTCLWGATPTKSLPGACGVFLTRGLRKVMVL